MHSYAQVGTSLVETRDSLQRAAVALQKVQILNNKGVFALVKFPLCFIDNSQYGLPKKTQIIGCRPN